MNLRVIFQGMSIIVLTFSSLISFSTTALADRDGPSNSRSGGMRAPSTSPASQSRPTPLTQSSRPPTSAPASIGRVGSSPSQRSTPPSAPSGRPTRVEPRVAQPQPSQNYGSMSRGNSTPAPKYQPSVQPRQIPARQDFGSHGSEGSRGATTPSFARGQATDRRGYSSTGYQQDTRVQQHMVNNSQRMQHMQDNPGARQRVEHYQTDFRSAHYAGFQSRRVVHVEYINTCHTWYRPYYRYGFHGGFYWGFRPIIDPAVYFWNPLWSWFYVETVDPVVVTTWYGHTYTVSYSPFRYRRVYYPTVEFRDIVVSVSNMPSDAQIRFQDGMNRMTDQIAQKIANLSGQAVTLGENDLVINNRQILQDRAVVVEGFVDTNGSRYGFKGFIDLQYPAQTFTFVPGNPSGLPSYEDQQQLEAMNYRIISLGGTVDRTEGQ